MATVSLAYNRRCVFTDSPKPFNKGTGAKLNILRAGTDADRQQIDGSHFPLDIITLPFPVHTSIKRGAVSLLCAFSQTEIGGQNYTSQKKIYTEPFNHDFKPEC